MFKYFVIILTFLSWAILAQERSAFNRLYFSYTLQNYKDKESVKNDGAHPGRALYPKNADSHYWGLQYERVTAYGLVYGGGLQYGRRNYVMSMAQPMKGFDPEAENNVTEYRKGLGSVHSHVRYWGGRVFMGYRKSIGRNWAATARIGMAEKLFRQSFQGQREIDIHYTSINGDIKDVPSALIEFKYGRQSGKGLFKAPNALLSYECYIGVEREYKKRYLKTLSIGIEGARGVWMWDHYEVAMLYSSPTIDQLKARKETFIDRNISLGLRVAVGLWK